jgi:hypothetical protein
VIAVPECAVPLPCSIVVDDVACRRVAIPGTMPRVCEAHLVRSTAYSVSRTTTREEGRAASTG